MDQASFLRLAMVLSDGQGQTFKANLQKIVMLVLAENYCHQLTISNIVQKIKERYSLDFADGEVKAAITSIRDGAIIESRQNLDPVYYTYSLSPNAYQKYKLKDITDPLQPFIEKFCEEPENYIPFSCEEMKDVVYRFLYKGFNSDIQTVLALMNYRGEKKQWHLEEKGFSNDEIVSLDAFLNWKNVEKNQLIFKYASFCYEYCVMTVKKDKSVFTDIFRGKEFYLDANVIFRLTGFNKEERKASMDAFLNKCRSCGVVINYSNFTNVEIGTTLEHYVESIEKILANQEPISIKAMVTLSPKYANLDFYAQYVEWVKNPKNNAGDYRSFLDYLKRTVTRCTTPMNLKACESFKEGNTKDRFKEYCDSLREFKAQRGKQSHEKSIQVDVENYMMIRKLAGRNTANSFFEQKYSFITTDHAYIDWTRQMLPGTMPLFVLPSVWYSIMLKYHGRTDDDYTAFCQFLNLRVSEAQDEMQGQKMQLLARVLELDERAEIKEEIIFDISRKLSETKSFIEDIGAFVEESHERITDKKVSAAVAEANNAHAKEIVDLEEESKQRQLHANDVGYSKGHVDGLGKGRAEGLKQGRKEVIKKQAARIVERNRKIHVAFYILAFISAGIFIVMFILGIINEKKHVIAILENLEKHGAIITLISSMSSIISFCIARLEKYVPCLSMNVHQIESWLERKLDV